MARRCQARQGFFRSYMIEINHGAVGTGRAWQSEAWLGSTWHGWARLDKARLTFYLRRNENE